MSSQYFSDLATLCVNQRQYLSEASLLVQIKLGLQQCAAVEVAQNLTGSLSLCQSVFGFLPSIMNNTM